MNTVVTVSIKIKRLAISLSLRVTNSRRNYVGGNRRWSPRKRLRGNSGSNQKSLKRQAEGETKLTDFGEWSQVFASVERAGWYYFVKSCSQSSRAGRPC